MQLLPCLPPFNTSGREKGRPLHFHQSAGQRQWIHIYAGSTHCFRAGSCRREAKTHGCRLRTAREPHSGCSPHLSQHRQSCGLTPRRLGLHSTCLQVRFSQRFCFRRLDMLLTSYNATICSSLSTCDRQQLPSVRVAGLPSSKLGVLTKHVYLCKHKPVLSFGVSTTFSYLM